MLKKKHMVKITRNNEGKELEVVCFEARKNCS
jgi:hypothetical protein